MDCYPKSRGFGATKMGGSPVPVTVWRRRLTDRRWTTEGQIRLRIVVIGLGPSMWALELQNGHLELVSGCAGANRICTEAWPPSCYVNTVDWNWLLDPPENAITSRAQIDATEEGVLAVRSKSRRASYARSTKSRKPSYGDTVSSVVGPFVPGTVGNGHTSGLGHPQPQYK